MQRMMFAFTHGLPRLSLSALVAILALAACNRGREAAATSSVGTNAGASEVKTLPSDFDPCSFVTIADVQRLIAPVKGAPSRGLKADQPEPTKNGKTCVFALASGAADTLGAEVVTEDAATSETASHMVTDGLSKNTGINMSVGEKNANGWDYDDAMPGLYAARLGHIAIHIAMNSQDAWNRLPRDSVAKLAALMRDRIPDLPIASPHKQHSSDGVDNCALLTRQEAESVLGKLTVPPYRSLDESALAEPNGAGCSYYLGHHRVFSLTAEREIGQQAFKMASSMNNRIVSKIGAKGSSADTLEGSWDQAGSGPGGSLLFLKGNKLLTVDYLTAGVGVEQATKLAAIAIRRL